MENLEQSRYSKKPSVAAHRNIKEREYWLNQLAGELVKTNFPYDYKKAPANGRTVTTFKFKFTGELFSKLVKFINGSDIRLNIMMMAALVLLLYKYTASKDIILGSPIYKQDIEGDFINTVLAVRNQVRENITFKEFLLQVGKTFYQANQHQNYPIETLLFQLNITLQETGDFPLFDMAILLENIHHKQYLQHVNLNMVFIFRRTDEYIEGVMEYNSLLYKKTTIERIAAHFRNLLEAGLGNINILVEEMSILAEEEKKQVLHEFNNTALGYPKDKTLHQLYEEQANKYPDHIAVSGPGYGGGARGLMSMHPVSLTYRELNKRANRLARVLKNKGVRPGAIAAIVLERSVEVLIGILGIMKGGAAYLPINPGTPQNRICTMLKDCHASILLTMSRIIDLQATIPTKAGSEQMEQRTQLQVISLDTFNEMLSKESPENPQPVNLPENLAYVIFTSGSTGKPKGTMIEHRSVNNLVSGLKETIYKNYRDHLRVSLVAPFEFDASVQQIFGALLQGHHLHVVPKSTRLDGARLLEFYKKYQIHISDGTPTHIRMLLESMDENKISLDMRHFIIAGEAFPLKIAERFLNCFKLPSPNISNLYGPTETCVDSTIYHIHISTEELNGKDILPIGKSLPNQQVYILDKKNRLHPIGVAGELCIGGDGVARGYLNNPELTAEKFYLQRPGGRFLKKLPREASGTPRKNFLLEWTRGPRNAGSLLEVATPSPELYSRPYTLGSRLYKTGDLARWLPDGNIEFLGRMDHQVKLRGFRIELGEIENKMKEIDNIKEALATVIEDKTGDKAICVFYVEKKNQQPELWPSVGEYFVWDELLYHAMTHDEPRNKSYKVAINQLVQDKTVVEIGTGPDVILARFCIEAGARKVYAIEILKESYKKAKETVKQLGLEEKIILIYGEATNVQLPEKVDVCLSQIFGNIASSEGAIHILNHARRFLKEDGVILPHRCETKIASLYLPDLLHETPGFSEVSRFYPEKIFKKFGYKFDFRICINNFPKSNIVSNADNFESLDFSKKIDTDNSKKIKLIIHKKARIDGLLLWIRLFTTESEIIDTSENKYLWSPVFVPVFYPGIEVSVGDIIEAECSRTHRSGLMTPDYKIEGVLKLLKGEVIEFSYDLPYLEKSFRKNAFYQKLFASDSIREIKNLVSFRKLTISALREHLSKDLPDYMIPTYFVELEEIPLAANGKVKRSELSLPEIISEDSYAAPTNQLEEKVEEIWSEILAIDKNRIGIDTNFFELGGHSLKATILSQKIHKELNIKMPLIEIFRTPTIRGLARYLKEMKREMFVSIESAEEKEYYMLSSAQRRLYLQHRLNPTNVSYNAETIMVVEGEPEKEKLASAFEKLINRHENFRTAFEIITGEPVQMIQKSVDFNIEYHDLSKEETRVLAPFSIEPATCHSPIAASFIQDFIRPFDLSKAPLLRVGLIKEEDKKHILMMDMHHIIFDGISFEIFIKEITALHQGEGLSPLKLHYKDYSEWKNSDQQREIMKRQQEYWLKIFEKELPVLNLPADYPRPVIQSFEGSSLHFSIGKDETEKLRRLIAEEEVTLYMLLLTILYIFLSKISGQIDIVIGSSIACRVHEDLQGIIGLFASNIALRNYPKPEKTFKEFLREVKTRSLEAFENQEFHYEELVEQVIFKRDFSRNPLFDVLFEFHDIKKTAPGLPGITLKPYAYNSKTVKLDLSLVAIEIEQYLSFTFIYCTKLFKPETIEKFVNYFTRIVFSVLENPDKKLFEIEIMAEKEKENRLNQFNHDLEKESYR